MFSLMLPADSTWLEFPRQGVRLRVRPYDGAVLAAADARARRVLAEMMTMQAEAVALGLVDTVPDLTDADIRAGIIAREFAVGLAAAGIEAWEGVGDAQGAPAECSLANRQAFGRTPLGLEFAAAYERQGAALDAEGNASAAGPNGSTDPAATTAPAARRGSKAAPGRALAS